MKIVVIGGAGFIGSSLCRELAKDPKNEIISIDCYFTGSVHNHVMGVKYIQGYAKDIRKHLGGFIADIVFHFGEYSRVEQSFDDVATTFELNQQIVPVLEYCRHFGSKLVYSGSSTKFADNAAELSPYTVTKINNTNLIETYSKWFDINYATVYFYNVYGESEINSGKYATIIAKFLQQYKAGRPLTVRLPGTQRRNFTHIDDVVSALILVAKHGNGDNYGIGHDDSYSIEEVAHMLSDDIIHLEERPGNRLSAPVISDKTKALGWTTKRSLPEYLEKYKND